MFRCSACSAAAVRVLKAPGETRDGREPAELLYERANGIAWNIATVTSLQVQKADARLIGLAGARKRQWVWRPSFGEVERASISTENRLLQAPCICGLAGVALPAGWSSACGGTSGRQVQAVHLADDSASAAVAAVFKAADPAGNLTGAQSVVPKALKKLDASLVPYGARPIVAALIRILTDSVGGLACLFVVHPAPAVRSIVFLYAFHKRSEGVPH